MTTRTRRPVYRIRRAQRRFYRWVRMEAHGDITNERITAKMDQWHDITNDLLDKFFPGQDPVHTLIKIMNGEIK